MTDLRKLSAKDREALALEATRRAQSGENPAAIQAALGLSKRTYSTWANKYGFQACAPPPAPPHDPIEAIGQATRSLRALQAALDEGDRPRANKLMAAWKTEIRWQRDLIALEKAAADENQTLSKDIDTLSDAELAAEVSALIGRTIRIKPTAKKS